MVPASTMRQLAHTRSARGRQLQRQESRISSRRRAAASPIVSVPSLADLERQLGLAAHAPQRVEEHLVAARRAVPPLHIAGSLAEDRARMPMTDRRAVTWDRTIVRADDDGPDGSWRRSIGRSAATPSTPSPPRRCSDAFVDVRRRRVARRRRADRRRWLLLRRRRSQGAVPGDRRPVSDDGPGPMGPTRLRCRSR